MVTSNVLHKLLEAHRGASFCMLSETEYSYLLVEGFVEIAIDNKDPVSGLVPTRLTEKGMVHVMSLENVTDSELQVEASPMVSLEVATVSQAEKFEIVSRPILHKKRVAKSTPAKYPFDALEIGFSFFVPNTKERPSAVKTMTSAVAAANKRNSTPTGETRVLRNKKVTNIMKYTKKFSLESGSKDGVEGAWVGRIAI